MKGKKHSEAAKAKMRKKHKKLNLECRKLHSEIVKNLWKNPKIREKLCKNRKGRKCSEETKIKMKLAWIKRKANHND